MGKHRRTKAQQEATVNTTSKWMMYCCLVIFVLSLTAPAFAQDAKSAPTPDQTLGAGQAAEGGTSGAVAPKEGSKWYVGAIAGGVLADDLNIANQAFPGNIEPKPGFALGVAAGFKLPYARMEAEFSYLRNSLNKVTADGKEIGASGAISNFVLLINGYLDFKNRTAFTPYLTAGIGASNFNIDSMPVKVGGAYVTENANSVVFAYQLGAGVGFAVTDHWTIDLKGRYFATSDPELGKSKLKFKSSNIFLGARYSF